VAKLDEEDIEELQEKRQDFVSDQQDDRQAFIEDHEDDHDDHD
jgi:hypothetical protein